ncbi:hypothetical protein QFZ49_000531 [Streptomyces turgidiscabies]|uniref:Uncharacterized protein n=1 Tax=Streptomyces turgidiscabies TaxID=85558 RepID=A0ABU0RF56_9ACTN|nr:hypothetical protein [Streptomyces turgidiscabies]
MSPGTSVPCLTLWPHWPTPPERHCDAPCRSHEIRFTTGLKPDALRMKLGSHPAPGVVAEG